MLNAKRIGNKISEARKRTNITQAQLAGQLFISAQAVGKWERGESMPDILTLNRIAAILGVNLNYFSESTGSFDLDTASAEAQSKAVSELKSGTLNHVAGKSGNKSARDMSHWNWADADFSGLKNLHEKFGSSNLQRCKFSGSDLSEIQFKRNFIDRCDFSGSDMKNSQICNSFLSDNLFTDCSLKEVRISGSYISGCDFTGSDFTGAGISSGGFEKNTLSGAIWKRTSFTDTLFSNLVFEGVMEDCCFDNCTFQKVTFQGATLINTFFKTRSLKRVKFTNCRADRISLEFLKSGKADISGINLIVP